MHRSKLALCSPVLLALLIPAVAFSQAGVRQVRISDRVACAGCSIEFKRIAILGDEDGPGMLPSRPYDIAIGSDGRYYVAMPESGDEPPMVFARSGRYIGSLGRAGNGPGEFRVVGAIETNADTVFVFDKQLARLTVLWRNRILWTAPIPRASFSAARLSDGTLALNARVRDADRIGLPVHLFDARGNTRGSIGADTLMIDPRNGTRDAMWLQPGRNGSLLGFPYTHTYTIDRWSATGKHLGSWHREPPWFRPFDTPWDKSPAKPPIPMSMGGFEDGAGRIWALYLTAGPKWSTGLGKPIRGEGGVPIYPTTNRQLLYQSRIDIIDPQQGVLLVSDSIPGTFDMVIAPNILGAIRERESGALVVEVWQVTLSTKRGLR